MNVGKSTLVALLLTGLWCAPGAGLQDPPPAAPPPAASPSTPAGGPERHPLEGVYRLHRRVVGGIVDPKPSSGWLAITQRHLFVCLAAPGPDPEVPLLRTGVRTWTEDEGVLHMSVRMGWFTDADGNVQIESPDAAEQRRVELVRGGVRLWQDRRDHLDFERVE